MKAEKWTFWYVAIFFGVVAPIYWFISHEIAGSLALAFTCLMGLLIAGYLTITARTFDPRPEDRPDAEVVDAAGDVGFFAPSSIWPFWCAVTVAIIFLGPALHQGWITIVGIGFGIWAASGWILQFYRGEYRH